MMKRNKSVNGNDRINNSDKINRRDKVTEDKRINRSKNVTTGENYLDFIFCKKEDIIYSKDDSGNVTIDIINKGLFNLIARKLFKRPKITHIHLDDMGSFIWSYIDGKNTVYDIGKKVGEHFGESAEPLYERLVVYVRMLESYGFIRKR
ncbi:MAG: PqqD family protein [Lachnospiraceae bacterium]|nr:PqqD family protein [Lachnospiraceae bacterium]